MVSMPIHPFVISVVLTNMRINQQLKLGALIDSGCTRCLITQAVVHKFEQVDGSILVGTPATHRTEMVRMDMGHHWEKISFVVVNHMTEAVIWGLSWLDKWCPTIHWEGGFRKIHLVVGPGPIAETSTPPTTVNTLGNQLGRLAYPIEYTDLA
ncbi:hypothetical protein E2320_022583, partial [Naja naja]